jgi:hypothetical protein
MKNEEVLHRVKEKRNIINTLERGKINWIGYILCRICLLRNVTEGRIEMTERRGRRSKQLLDNLRKTRAYSKLKEEALDHTLWRTRCGRGYGHVRQTK